MKNEIRQDLVLVTIYIGKGININFLKTVVFIIYFNIIMVIHIQKAS